jgi:hypothetical protein
MNGSRACERAQKAGATWEERFRDARRWLTEAELHQQQHDPVGLLVLTTALQVGVACSIGDDTMLPRCRAAVRAGEHPLPIPAAYLACAEGWAVVAAGDRAGAQRILLDGADARSGMPMHGARLTYEAMRKLEVNHRHDLVNQSESVIDSAPRLLRRVALRRDRGGR